MTKAQRQSAQASMILSALLFCTIGVVVLKAMPLWSVVFFGFTVVWIVLLTNTFPNGTKLFSPFYAEVTKDGKITVSPIQRNLYVIPLAITFMIAGCALAIDIQSGSNRAIGILICGFFMAIASVVIGTYNTPTIHFLALSPNYFEVKATRFGKELYHARSTNPEFALPEDTKLRVNGLIAHNIEIISGTPPSTGVNRKPFAWDPTLEVHIPPLKNAHRDELNMHLIGENIPTRS